MKRLLFILIFQFSTLFAFSQWIDLGLDDYQVNDLTVHGDTIYASTNDGIYKKNIFSTDNEWLTCGNQGHYIVQTLVENYNTFISLMQIEETYTAQIYKSTDAGLSFSLMSTDTSDTDVYTYQYLDHMAHPANNYDTLYFLYHQMKTNNGGSTWESINNSIGTDRFIMVNPTNPAQLIIGGEGDLFNAYLQVSNDYGETWELPSMSSFFNGDNAIHDIAIDESTWYAAGEGVICKTTDEGENWTTLLNLFHNNTSPFSLYYTNIEFSPANNHTLYVSGLKSAGSDQVSLLYSENQGVNWDTIWHNSVAPIQRIRCLTVANIDDTDNVFLGGNGVYVYKRVISSVKENISNLDLTIYPNPTTDNLNIHYTSKGGSRLTANVFDLQGRLMSQQSLNQGMGEQKFLIDITSLSKGTYVLQLLDGDKKGSREFVVR